MDLVSILTLEKLYLLTQIKLDINKYNLSFLEESI